MRRADELLLEHLISSGGRIEGGLFRAAIAVELDYGDAWRAADRLHSAGICCIQRSNAKNLVLCARCYFGMGCDTAESRSQDGDHPAQVETQDT